MDNKLKTGDDSNSNNGNSSVRESLVTSETVVKKSKKRTRDVSTDSNDDNSDSDSSYRRKKSKKSKKKKLKKKKSKKVKKKKRSSDSSSSDSDDCKKNKRKRKEEKKLKKLIKSENDLVLSKTLQEDNKDDETASFGPAVPEDIASKSRAFVPMTKEEWEKQQSRIRRVYDPETGRHRLIRGDGEVVEECVSRDRHRQINKQATAADGLFFQMNVTKK